MSSFNIQQQHRKMPASESAPLNAGLLKNDTGSSAIAVSLLNLHEPFPVLSKPFDHPRAYCSASAGALAQYVLRVPTATNPPHISNSKTQITHDMVDRPWAVQVAKQALTDSVAHTCRASQHFDPLSRWQAESTADGPYHMIASVSRPQHECNQIRSRKETRRIVASPSKVSAARGSSRDVRQCE